MGNTPCPLCGKPAVPGHSCPGTEEKMLGRLLDGRYRIDGLLGQGGMGSVYRGLQISVQRPVAVKTLHPYLAASKLFFERFRREAETASRLKHPNVITTFDFGRTEDGLCYIVMELVEGKSLRQLVKKSGPLSLRRAVNVIEQAAHGLAHAHASGVIHRDMKPHNIMVTELEGREYAKVLDFGLVKMLQEEGEEKLTTAGQVLGTPQYMPPEQAAGEELDGRSDLFSLASVFYYCLTGSSPYGAKTVQKALDSVLHIPLPSVNSRRNGAPVPPAIDAFMRKAMHAEADRRYPDADAFVEGLQEAIDGCTAAQLDEVPEGAEAADNLTSPPPAPPRRHTAQELPRTASPRPRTPDAMPPTKQARAQTPGVAAPSSPRPPSPLGANRISKPPPPVPNESERESATELRAMSADDTGTMRDDPRKPTLGDRLRSLPINFVIGVGALLVVILGGVIWWSSMEREPDAKIEVVNAAGPVDGVRVTLRSSPPGAKVYEGDVEIAQTPSEVRLARARHTLSFRMEGHTPQQRSLDLSHPTADSTSMDVPMPPLKAPLHRHP